MPEYAPGTTSWIELSSSDTDAETYTVWEIGGKQVGGMMQMTDGRALRKRWSGLGRPQRKERV
jgi:hypothetical protein